MEEDEGKEGAGQGCQQGADALNPVVHLDVRHGSAAVEPDQIEKGKDNGEEDVHHCPEPGPGGVVSEAVARMDMASRQTGGLAILDIHRATVLCAIDQRVKER